MLARLMRSGPQVLATGGGAFMNADTRAMIAELGISVWLKAELPLLVRRVAKRNNRPLLKGDDPQTVMQKLMDVRYPIYAQADLTVESRDVPHDVIVAEIIERLATTPPAARPEEAQ